MDKLKCAFFATPGIAIDALSSLHENPYIDLSLVVSMPDRPAGRGKKLKSPEIIERARELNIPILQSENINKSDEFQSWSEENPLDLIIVFAFAQFLGQEIINQPSIGCFNIHTSLLPKYRGAAPMQYALFNGDSTTGLCIQKMVKKMDAGNIVKEKEIKIEAKDNLGSLHDKLKALAPEVLSGFISDLKNGTVVEEAQDESQVSFAPSIPKGDTLLNFKDHTNIELHNKIRGLSPIPGAYCFLNNKRLKVFESELSDTSINPGEVDTKFNTILVGTKSGSIRLKTIQQEGKPKRGDFDVLNGFKSNNTPIKISSEKDS